MPYCLPAGFCQWTIFSLLYVDADHYISMFDICQAEKLMNRFEAGTQPPKKQERKICPNNWKGKMVTPCLAPVSRCVASEQEKRVRIPLNGLERLCGAVYEK
jgi:hypothetical protein